MWALRKILRIPYTRHITNDEVRSCLNCQPLSSIVTSRRLRFFGHIARSSPDEDHHRAIAAAIRKPPPDWRRPAGRPSYTWLRSVEADLRPLNIGLSSAWRKASGWRTGAASWTRPRSGRVRHKKKSISPRFLTFFSSDFCGSLINLSVYTTLLSGHESLD